MCRELYRLYVHFYGLIRMSKKIQKHTSSAAQPRIELSPTVLGVDVFELFFVFLGFFGEPGFDIGAELT